MSNNPLMSVRSGGQSDIPTDNGEEWGDPLPFPDKLLPVENLHPIMFPDTLRAWATDCALRMDNMPLDFFAVSVLVSLSSVIGSRVGIRPKRNNRDWVVHPNLWGGCVGRPATLKTPSMKEGTRFIRRLEADANRRYQEAFATHELEQKAQKIFEEQQTAQIKKEKSLTREQISASLREVASDAAEPPVRERFMVMDATVEKLGDLLQKNPNGLLLYRDELTGWLAKLDARGHEQDRAFYLEAWDGNGDFAVDRIGRGEMYIQRVIVSILGGIQPNKLARYLRSMETGEGDDGLIQRFQLMVWPDQRVPEPTDEAPCRDSREAVTRIFERILKLPLPADDESCGAILNFDDEAQESWNGWYRDMRKRECSEPNPHIESHLTKYHSLMPSLALIFHLVEGGSTDSKVGIDAVDRARAWCRYLETHARRVYGLMRDPYYSAKQLLAKLPELSNPFQKTHFRTKGWSGLESADERDQALRDLVAHNFLIEEKIETPGRPAHLYHINPKCIEVENYSGKSTDDRPT